MDSTPLVGQGHLGSGSREFSHGIETYCYPISSTIFEHITLLAMRDGPTNVKQKAIKNFLAGHYMFYPRPQSEEILSIDLQEHSDYYAVELKIQRGHYIMAEFLRKHGGDRHSPTITESDSGDIVLSCSDCSTKPLVSLAPESLPEKFNSMPA